jgi:hypothetical protein
MTSSGWWGCGGVVVEVQNESAPVTLKRCCVWMTSSRISGEVTCIWAQSQVVWWQDHEGRSRVEVSAAKVAFAQLPKPCISGQTRDDDHFLYVG